jgi:bifunctional non-homologous end joining protein LigD
MSITVEVSGRRLTLTNLDKPLYPSGFTKAEVIDYYSRIAATMLPHLHRRPVTLTRWPDGVTGEPFFAKNVPAGAPEWLESARVPTGGRGRATVTAPLVSDTAGLVYLANLAGLEVHVPQWRLDRDNRPGLPDLLVVDLDPGPPAGLLECCEVALVARELLRADGIEPLPKTSGRKGMQLLARVATTDPEAAHGYARRLAASLALALPGLVVDRMATAARTGRVFVDWSQNHVAKNTIAAYSLRADAEPTVSTPLTWTEVAACRRPEQVRFGPAEVLQRVADHDDLLAPLLEPGPVASLPSR